MSVILVMSLFPLMIADIPRDGLLAYYPFDSDLKSSYPVTEGPDLYKTGDVILTRRGKLGGCITFAGAGIGNVLLAPHGAEVFAFTSQFTVSFWLHLEKPTEEEMTLIERYDGSQRAGWTITLLPRKGFEFGTLRIDGAKDVGITQGEILRADDFFNETQQKHIRKQRLVKGWNHIVVCRRPTRTNEANHYDTVIVINGHMSGIRPEENALFKDAPGRPLQIGRRWAKGYKNETTIEFKDGGITYKKGPTTIFTKDEYPFDGRLDEVLIWGRGLSEPEVSGLWEHYNNR